MSLIPRQTVRMVSNTVLRIQGTFIIKKSLHMNMQRLKDKQITQDHQHLLKKALLLTQSYCVRKLSSCCPSSASKPDLKDKIVIITGGATGIGLSIVKKLLATDIKVIALFELETPNTTKVIKELQCQYCDKIEFYPCDVTTELQCNFDKFMGKHQTVDILINNAGILNERDAGRMIDINYKAAVLGSLMMIDRVGKHKCGKGGVIVNVASILGLMNYVKPVYCSTKHALVSFTRTMKEHTDKTGVRVMALCPGVTDTGMLDDFPRGLDFYEADELNIVSLAAKQSVDNVVKCFMHMMAVGKSGDIWVSEEEQPPYAVKDCDDYKNMRQ